MTNNENNPFDLGTPNPEGYKVTRANTVEPQTDGMEERFEMYIPKNMPPNLPIELAKKMDVELLLFIRAEISLALKKRDEDFRKMILDVIEKTNWIEEPKSAFGQLNNILKSLLQSSQD